MSRRGWPSGRGRWCIKKPGRWAHPTDNGWESTQLNNSNTVSESLWESIHDSFDHASKTELGSFERRDVPKSHVKYTYRKSLFDKKGTGNALEVKKTISFDSVEGDESTLLAQANWCETTGNRNRNSISCRSKPSSYRGRRQSWVSKHDQTRGPASNEKTESTFCGGRPQSIRSNKYHSEFTERPISALQRAKILNDDTSICYEGASVDSKRNSNYMDSNVSSTRPEDRKSVSESTLHTNTVYGNRGNDSPKYINGCRPKTRSRFAHSITFNSVKGAETQKMKVVSGHEMPSAVCESGNSSYINSTDRTAVASSHATVNEVGPNFGFPYLKQLEDKDPAYVVMALTKSTDKLRATLKRTETEPDLLQLLVSVLSVAFDCQSTPHLTMLLFDTLTQTRFFDTVALFLLDLQSGAEEKEGKAEEKVEKTVRGLTRIMWTQVTRNPSSLMVFNRVHTIIGQTIPILTNSPNPNNQTVISEFQQFTSHKKHLEKTLRRHGGNQGQYMAPEDFRRLTLLPAIPEVKGQIQPFLRKNIIDGEYSDKEHYLDTQFRLLREDFVGPLREGIVDYTTISNSEHPEVRRRKTILKIFNSVQVFTPFVGDYGLCYKMKITLPARMRTTDLKAGKKLLFGSLICLSVDDFNSISFATVVNNDELEKGILSVQFCDQSLETSYLLGKVFKMVESPAYYEAYKHVLNSLQTILAADFPFERYIVHCENNVFPPGYINEDTTYDLSCLVDKNIKRDCSDHTSAQMEDKSFTELLNRSKSVAVLSQKVWPSASSFHMDKSQFAALQRALSNEFAIIQGPPGTGKTYVGLKIAQALLQNDFIFASTSSEGGDRKPMLVVCFTNHALDQFLAGMVRFSKGNVVRVGGRCQNPALENCILKNIKRKQNNYGLHATLSKRMKGDVENKIQDLAGKIDELCFKSEVYQSCLLSETCLREVMSEIHFRSIYYESDLRGKEGFALSAWLQIGKLEQDCRRQKLFDSSQTAYLNELVQVDTGYREAMEGSLPFLKKCDTKLQRSRIQNEVSENFGYGVVEKIQKIQYEISVLEKQIRKKNVKQINGCNHPKKKQLPENKLSRLENLLQIEQNVLQYMKTEVKNRITQRDVMTPEEVNSVTNVWKLTLNQRWQLYRFWIQQLLKGLCDKVDSMKPHFETAAESFKEIAMQEEKEILKQARVIGMTTTCAARYQAVLRDIKPSIIIVEEAAEVLESHIVTSLNSDCKHLILIGDHKQLRPNPSVYRLATKYNLDVSLFERMIRNDVPYSCLHHQHRMRPEIADIVRFIYPQLKDHPDVEAYEDVQGIKGNLLFLNHNHPENSNENVKSYSNAFEAEYATKLCKYLLMQGYSPENITILTTYTGQLFEIRKHMPEHVFKGVRVTVVDNYQGEENKIVILSLVRSNSYNKIGFLKTENRICVALSRAKYGFYILGNFDHLAAHSELWKKITAYAKEHGYFAEGISLYCQNHPEEKGFLAILSADFRKAPEGGCDKMCTFRLNCGHVCKRYCHVVDSTHELYKCQEDCTQVCELQHPCRARCHQPCPPCNISVTKVIPKCEHTQVVPCHVKPEEWICGFKPCPKTLDCGHPCKEKCGEEHTKQCKTKIDFTWPCGHTSEIKCWQRNSLKCPTKCEQILQCGHRCSGSCGSCFKGRFHDQCRAYCNRILVCGHECIDKCASCPPCQRRCENRCVHSKCPKPCGKLCNPCKEPCPWECAHFKCSRRCSEPCNRPPCNRPCWKKLPCRHKCIGLCGEPCPSLCKICNKDSVTEILFGREDEKNARFILLQDCGHIIEYRAMDIYMKQKIEGGNIQLKGCPRCKTTIRKSFRYGNFINKTLQDIEQVKSVIIGDQAIIKEIRMAVTAIPGGEQNEDTRRGYTRMIHRNVGLSSLQSQSNVVRNRIRDNLMHFERQVVISEQIMQTVKIQYDTATQLMNIINKVKKERYMEINLAQTQSGLPELCVFTSMLEKLLEPRTFISQQEVSDITAECYRGQTMLECMRIQQKMRTLGTDKQETISKEVISILCYINDGNVLKKESIQKIQKCLTEIKENMKVDGLGIDEEERLQIIEAVNLKRGHWFKCPNGHVYAIGDCGGANQKGKCPECKADIGGEHHRLAEGNSLATEMDGASYAAYSEEANNMMNFDLANLF